MATVFADHFNVDRFNGDRRRIAIWAAGIFAFSLYIAVAIFATLIFPPVFIVFMAPIVLAAIAAAPRGRAVPQSVIWPMLLSAAALMLFWPAYLHIKLGPLPIITPPRVLFYALTFLWLLDMAASPLRRGQFRYGLKRNRWLGGLVIGFFALNIMSVPIAEGSKLAAEVAFRQIIILFFPFCIFVTYVRRFQQLKKILSAVAIGGAIAAIIAVGEYATGNLLAAKLAPLMMSDALWIEITQELKSRDGVFRAQSTHTHPISLGEYLSICMPIAVAFGLHTRGRMRAFWFAAAITIIAGAMATNSRGAILSLLAGGAIIGGVFAHRTANALKGSVAMPLVGLASVFLMLGAPIAGVAVYQVVAGESGTSAARSSQGRVDQIKMAWPKIVKRPIGGYGAGRSARIVGYYGRALSLDNYYLSLAVELGLPGPICFIGILCVAIATSIRRARDNQIKFIHDTERWIWIGLASALFAFLVSRTIISQTGNLNLLFPLVGAIIGVNAGARRRAPALDDHGRRA